MQTHTTKTLFIILILALAVCAATGGFFYFIKNKMERVSALEAQAENYEAVQNRDSALRKLLEEQGPDISILKKRIIEDQDVVAFIESVESLGVTTGAKIEIGSVDVRSRGIENDPYELLDLQISAVGSWRSVFHVLTLIETLPYALVFNEAQVTQVGSQPEGAKVATAPLWEGSFGFQILKSKK